MSVPAFLRSELLAARGIEHGLGTRASLDAVVARLSCARQVHGVDLVAAPFEGGGEAPAADGVFSRVPGEAVGVYTADCVPILLATPDGRAVAAVHAGWRGSAARIAERAVALLRERFDARPAELLAAIGPCIGACCYEVDAPVHDAFADRTGFAVGARPGHWQLDLRAANRAQLRTSGLPDASIEDVGGCTACTADSYASYRRDGTAGRMLHWLRARA